VAHQPGSIVSSGRSPSRDPQIWSYSGFRTSPSLPPSRFGSIFRYLASWAIVFLKLQPHSHIKALMPSELCLLWHWLQISPPVSAKSSNARNLSVPPHFGQAQCVPSRIAESIPPRVAMISRHLPAAARFIASTSA